MQKNSKNIVIAVVLIFMSIMLIANFFNRKSGSLTNKSTPTPVVVEDSKDKILEKLKKDDLLCTLPESCVVEKISGNYAKGLMTQGYWMAKKYNGEWKVVVTGNGIPSCMEIDKYSIPKYIYGNCIETSGDLRN